MPEEEPLNPNPIVAMAMKLRARKDLDSVIDSASPAERLADTSAEGTLRAFGDELAIGSKRLNSILGKNGVRFIRLEKPLRLRLRFREKRLALDLDAIHQLINVSGEGLDGEYAPDPAAQIATLINLSRLSTDEGYARGITASFVLKALTSDAALPRPAHLDEPGPMRF